MEVLIDYGANVNAKELGGWTPLHFASTYGKDVVTEILLRNFALVDAKTASGNTPLHAAITYGK